LAILGKKPMASWRTSRTPQTKMCYQRSIEDSMLSENGF
jgi:hypothetical protein